MEVKKSTYADLERFRPMAFLLGLVVATVAFIVALEFSFSDRDDLFDADFLDEIAEDMEFMPPMEENIPLPEPETQTPSQTDQIKVVEEARPAEMESEAEQKPEEILTETELEEKTLEDEEEVVPFKEEEVKMMNEVDRLPEFPGGMAQLMKWLTKNLTYPEMAKARQISGRVVVSFIINSDGTVDDAKLLNTVDPMLDREALRVVKMMPKWNPGLSGGKACRTLVHMPVVFKL